jgi:small subunit ribosomal protein S20
MEGFKFVANIKSQIKRIKTNDKARLRNKSVRSSFKTAIRRFRDSLTAGDSKIVATELSNASRELDIAVKGVIHANQAANKKSAMAKSAHKAGVR